VCFPYRRTSVSSGFIHPNSVNVKSRFKKLDMLPASIVRSFISDIPAILDNYVHLVVKMKNCNNISEIYNCFIERDFRFILC
jgi:hypothetical protein